MKFSISLFLVALAAMLVYTRAVCPTGQPATCGTECYNPLLKRCLPGNHLCFIFQSLCGTVCYNPTLFRCIPPMDTSCPITFNVCGSTCYDPTVKRCIQNTICPITSSLCGSTCYDPTASRCVNGVVTPIPPGTCGTGTCGTQGLCFNPATHVCLSGSTICPINTQLCGISCFDPTVYECSNGLLSLISGAPPPPPPSSCGTGQALCGSQCYVLSQYKCLTGNHLCNCLAPNYCPGRGDCFSSTDYSCCGTTAANSGLVQGANQCVTGQNQGITTGVGCS